MPFALGALCSRDAWAVDGTWVGATTDWFDSTNWTSNPDVPNGTATFSNTGSTTIDSNVLALIGAIQFSAAPNASAFTINNNADFFLVNGTGIFNNSTNAQTFNVFGDGMIFLNASTASGGPGVVNIANSSFLTFQDTSTAGSANITNNTTGFINFYATSTAGTASFANDGSVTFNDSSTAGAAQITNNAQLNFYDSSNAGSATINNTTSGSIAFSGASKAGTAAITNDGTLDFSSSASADHATITNNAAITFAGTSTAGFATITYANNFASTTFSNTSSAGSATFQSGVGIIGNYTSFFDSSTAGNATITNSIGVVSFTDSATAGAATISNTGSLILGPAITSFELTSTAGSATITNNLGGITYFDDQSVAGTASILNNPGGTTFFGPVFGSTASADHANILNAAGSSGLGSGGVTGFAGASTAGNATITTENNAIVFFIDDSTGGAARFITAAGGVFDMSQLTSAGMTAGSIEGAGTYYLGDKQLTVGGNNLSTDVSGVISDGSCGCFGPAGIGGSLVKVGSGTLTLSGINLYTGATIVNGGTLSVNGSTALSSLTTVNSGGTLGGNGIVGNTAIDGGTLSPGNSVGLLTVQGSLTFSTASRYMVEVSPGNADRTDVTGTASLGGATVNASFANGSYVARQYTILNATGGLGGTTFNTLVNSNLPSGFKSSLSYDSNNAYLNVEIALAQYSGLNVNQQNVANALTGFFNSTGGIPLVFGTLTPAGLTQASGELATGSQQTTFDAMNLFLGLLTDPFVAGRGEPVAPASGASAYSGDMSPFASSSGKERDAYAAMARKAPPRADASFDQRWSVWAAGFGGSQTTTGNATLGSGTAASRVYGTAVGADYRISPNTLAGFALAGGGTNFSVANAIGSGRSDLFQAGAFIRHTAGPAYLSAALAYGWQDITTERTLTVAGIERLRAQFNANAYSGRLEGGYRVAHPLLALTPYAAGQFTAFDLPAYAESAILGTNTLALAYGGKTATATRSELGLRSDKSWVFGDGLFTLRGRAAWSHNYDTDRSIGAAFQTLPGASFVVNGAAPARNAALTTGSAELKFSSGLSLAATFEGEFSDVTRSYAGKGIARYVW